jgi:hypothetical protein
MAFNMKGSPAKLGTIQGTAGHSSALKKLADDKEARRKEVDPRPGDKTPLTPAQRAKMEKKMAEIGKQKAQAKDSPAKNLGAFVDGERVTYDAAREAERGGGNVTYTNKEQAKRNKEDLKSKDKQTRENAEQFERMEGYKGEKGKEKEFAKAKSDDAKAQKILEKRTKNLAKKGHKDAGVMDEEGRKGTTAKIHSDKAFEEANKNVKTYKDEKGNQIVKGAEKTWNTEGANPKGKSSGTKNVDDYKKEKKAKKIAELKAKANKQK